MTSPTVPPDDADGLALAAEYERARHAYGDFRFDPTGLTSDEAERQAWEFHLLWLAMDDAKGELQLHILEEGPVETETGLYKLDGDNRLAFHRTDSLYPGRTPCPN